MLSKEEIFQLRDRYLGRKDTGWDEDPETGAIIVYAENAIFYDGNYYSMQNGMIINHEGYVKMLRSKVGHMPLQLAGTGVIVYREQNGQLEVLLQLRVDCGKYGLPGGGIELGESYEECAVRELQQETALKADQTELNLLKVYAGPKHITKHPNSDIVYHTVVVYKLPYERCIRLNHQVDKSETVSLEWKTLSQIKEILKAEEVFPNNAPILQDIANVFFN